MRRTLILIALVGCGSDAQDAVEQAAEGLQEAIVENAGATVLGRIGGTVIASDQYFVEVLPHRDGLVQALVLDAEGEVISDAGALTVQVMGADGAAKDVTLEWDPTERRYIGQVEEELAAAGQVNVSVTAGGDTHQGTAAKLASAPETASRGGTVVVAGDFSAEVMGKPDGSVIAYLEGPEGPISADADVNVNVSLQGTDGSPHAVDLAWDPQVEAYVGRAANDVTWTSGPLLLSVENEGDSHRARVETVAVAAAPTHEGEVVVVGDMSVEVVPDDEGNLKAYVVDVDGAVADPQAHVVVVVDQRPVTLTWNAEFGAYHAPIDARFDAEAAPLHVVVTRRGHRHWGGIRVSHAPRLRPWHQRRVVLRTSLQGPPPHAPAVGLRRRGVRVAVRGPGGQIRVRGPAGMVRLNGPGHGVSIRTPGAMVRVRTPGAMVSVRTPGAMVRVRGPGAPMGMASVNVRLPGGGGVSVMARAGGMRGMRRGMR